MNILVACEESQAVSIAFRLKGHNAYSCDVINCSGGHPEFHIKQDVISLLNGHCTFVTMDGTSHSINKQWDMIIAFPPCTYLTFAGNQMLSEKLRTAEQIAYRKKQRSLAAQFFLSFINANCKKIAVENPLGYMSTFYRPADQIIHPYYFGDNEMKRTCLWLKGLPCLTPIKFYSKPEPLYKRKNGKNVYFVEGCSARNNSERQLLRSKTFPGIAAAMASQWGDTNSTYYLL